MFKKLFLGLAVAAAVGFGTVFGYSGEFGFPVEPQPIVTHPAYANYDVIVHSRDASTWGALNSQMAEHGAACEGPPLTHENHTYEGAVFACKDHLMTAINAAGYGVIYLTPSKLLDWSNGPATLTFDVSTHRSSTRDWWDLWLQDFAGNVALPLEGGLPDLQANDGNNIANGHQYLHIDGDGNINGFPAARSNGAGIANWNAGLQWTANSAAQRDTYMLYIDATKFSFCKMTGEPMGLPICWANGAPHNLTVKQMTVQLGHHSYNPRKDGAGIENTWHWSNVDISPSVPFTVIHSQRAVFGNGGPINFSAPAPANSYLRFAAVGAVTIDGQLVQPLKPAIHGESANNYFVPIPAGATSVNVGIANGWWGASMAEGFSVWSKNGAPPPSPATPTATSVPLTATATSVPPTPTSTSTPVVPTPTSTPQLGTCETWPKLPNGTYLQPLPPGTVLEKWNRQSNNTYPAGVLATAPGSLC